MATNTQDDVRELRLALVCYGGVSLAIYMHGITKELEKLARASTEFVKGGENPYERNQTEFAYFNALRRKQASDGFPTRVVVDIISGTSAGGINGVCLAKALTLGAPQDGLRDLWLSKGAILKLLSRLPKLPPLAGNRMLRWLGGAFAQMEGKGEGSFMPDDVALNLFVTTTDINGFTREIPINNPATVGSVINKHVFRFSAKNGVGDFDQAHNASLAFAARATSCFPGAFPATKLADIKRVEATAEFPGEFWREYQLAGSPVDKTFFVDGGVLDNFPFRHAVEAIAGKPAANEVVRRLLFIEPDPARRMAAPTGKKPGFVPTIWAGLSKLPRKQPIADALDELREHNRRVARVRAIITSVDADVLRDVRPLLDQPFTDANAGANKGALESGGVAFQAYLHLKLVSVVQGMATSLNRLRNYPPKSTQAAFVEAVLLRWAENEHLTDTDADLSDAQIHFLRTFDLGYGRRRLGFVIGRLKHWYDGAKSEERARLGALKKRLYALQGELDGVLGRASFLAGAVEAIFGEERLEPYLEGWRTDDFLADAGAEITSLHATLETYLDEALRDFGRQAYADLESLTAPLPAEARDDLRARYIGFPYWDSATYPARALTDVGELDAVEVVRVSPLDSGKLVQATAAKDKLRGVALGHFGAFFKRSWRENDYLWGRLDGAERLLWLIGDTSDLAANQAFEAIALEEGPALKKAKALIGRVESHVQGTDEAPPLPQLAN